MIQFNSLQSYLRPKLPWLIVDERTCYTMCKNIDKLDYKNMDIYMQKFIQLESYTHKHKCTHKLLED